MKKFIEDTIKFFKKLFASTNKAMIKILEVEGYKVCKKDECKCKCVAVKKDVVKKASKKSAAKK